MGIANNRKKKTIQNYNGHCCPEYQTVILYDDIGQCYTKQYCLVLSIVLDNTTKTIDNVGLCLTMLQKITENVG